MNNKILKVNLLGQRADFGWLSNLEKVVVKKFKIKKEISIVLATKAQIRQLNRVYRRKDKPTDVLSFNIDSAQILGEIVICPDIARINAKEDGKSYVSELKLLTVHGILHLLGYDHEKSSAEKKKQEAMEKYLLKFI